MSLTLTLSPFILSFDELKHEQVTHYNDEYKSVQIENINSLKFWLTG